MAVWLSMNMSYVGAGDYSNTSKVAVNVYVHWDTKSYNGYSPVLNVTVDGVNDAVNVSFNTGQTSSGSQNIYSRYWNIGRDSNGSAKTVYASASYATGTASGTIGTSTSLQLAAIGGSGGGDSGGSGSGGSSGGSSGDGDDLIIHKVTVLAGEHTTITLYNANQGYEIGSDDVRVSDGYKLLINVTVDKGYVLTSCTINDVEIDSGSTYVVYNDITIKTTAAIAVAYIDTEIIDYTHYTNDCTFVGHAYIDGMDYNGAGNVSAPSYSTSGKKPMGLYTISSPYRAVYFLKFTTPAFVGNSEYVRFVIPMNNSYYSGATIEYWLSSSDANYTAYAAYTLDYDEVIDENLIASGVLEFTSKITELDITIPNIALEANITYYLILYARHSTNAQRSLSVPTAITLGSIGDPILGSHIEQNTYQCYIDNGVSWDLYIPYIDDGTSWEFIY